MGAEIVGAGTETIRIHGVEKLHGAEHTIIPDRIEAGTFMVAAAVTGGHILIENVVAEHLRPVIAKLREMGLEIIEEDNAIEVSRKPLKSDGYQNITTSRFSNRYAITNDGSDVVCRRNECRD